MLPTFPKLVAMALMVVVLLFSVIIHEIAHGYVALRNGDPTARMLGRITLNPIPHIDPIGTILLPLLLLISGAGILFGWARPVPVNPRNYRNYRLGELTVSAAGPLSNLALAVLFALLAHHPFGNVGLLMLASFGVQINIFLALFNLIPIPPLDGEPFSASQSVPSLFLFGAGGVHPHPGPLLHRNFVVVYHAGLSSDRLRPDGPIKDFPGKPPGPPAP